MVVAVQVGSGLGGVNFMDAFREPALKDTEDLLSAFYYYLGHGCFTTQEDVTRFQLICLELNYRKVDYSEWL